MSSYGIQILNEFGSEIFSASDRIGRIVGSHIVTLNSQTMQSTLSFPHQELSQFGELFIWSSSASFFAYSGSVRIWIDNYTIFLALSLAKVQYTYDQVLTIFYGVK